MSWMSDLLSGNDHEADGRDQPADARILQLRRGISATAEALEDTHPDLAHDAVAAADAVGDRVARLLSTAGEDGAAADEAASPPPEADAAGERRRSAGGAAVGAGSGGVLSGDVASEAVDRLEQLHFHLLEVEVRGADPEALPIAEELDGLRAIVDRLPAGDTTAGR